MASVKFFIRTASKKQTKPVNIRVRLRDIKDAYAKTHLSIPIKYWNQTGKNTRSKISNSGEFKERDWYKNQLEDLERFILHSFQENGKLTSEWLSECIERFRDPSQFEEKPVTLFEFIEKFISQAETAINPKTGKPMHKRILGDYKLTYDLLKEFAGPKQLNFDDIDLDFYTDFIRFMQGKNIGNDKKPKHYKANTIGKYIKNIKIFMNRATEDGINTNLRYKSHRFVKIQVDTESVYLNEKELSIIQDHDFTKKPHLERTRDLFLVGCWTGLRFGDLIQVKPENIKDGFIYVTQSKTGDRVVIPLHPVVKSILEKYDGQLPAISNHKTNLFLKDIAKEAGIKEKVHIAEIIGGVKTTVSHQKWELISTHTARRSMATNLYKSGFPPQSIMKITGHKSEKDFLKYIKVTPEEHAKLLQMHWAKNSNYLKVV